MDLCFQATGDSLIQRNTPKTELNSNSLCLKVSGDVRLVTIDQNSLKGVIVDIPTSWIARFDLLELTRATFLGLRTPELANLGYRLYQESRRSDDFSALVIEALVLELLVALIRQNRLRKPISPGWIKRIEELIRSNPAGTPSLFELSSLVGYHPVYMARSFRAFTGMTIGEFVRAQRLDRARQLLKNSELSLAEIAQLAGFSDQSHLTRLFRRCLNMTPKQLRDRFGGQEMK
jgi:AraC family transcriptional regulator